VLDIAILPSMTFLIVLDYTEFWIELFPCFH
jgi:hypothetical protein